MEPVRVVFMGTAEIACPSLAALLACPQVRVTAVVIQPDRPVGRSLQVQPPPVKRLAQARGLPVLQPERVRHPEAERQLAELHPDLIVVMAYGQILPQTVLDLPRFGCVNVHASLLPKYRGAAPIQWALANGEQETGVTIMQMDAGMDTGPILSQRPTPIGPEDTAETLHDRLAALGAALLLDTLPGYLAGSIRPTPQPSEGVSYAPRLRKEDGRIDWRLPARVIWNRLRAFKPWPGLFTYLPASGAGGGSQRLLKLWEAEVVPQQGQPGLVLAADNSGIVVGCGTDALRVLTLQREGGRRMSAREFLAGCPLGPGVQLGDRSSCCPMDEPHREGGESTPG